MKLKNMYRKGYFVLIFIFTFVLFGITNVNAKIYEVSDKTTFLNRMNNASDGDIIKLVSDIHINKKPDGISERNPEHFDVPANALVTLDLNGHTLYIPAAGSSNDIGVKENSALLIKNGTIDNAIDTNEEDSGIFILSGVSVTSLMYLGTTQAWLVNNTSIPNLAMEYGSVNPNSDASLHPITTQNTTVNYNYENSVPAIIGSKATWKTYSTLQEDFSNLDGDTYKIVLLLKDSTITADSILDVSGIIMDFSGYALTVGDYFKISNTTGSNIVRNGTVNGSIDMTTGNGEVIFTDMNVSGTINNSTHAVNITSGHYNNITTGTGKVTITDGYYKGILTGDSYKISGGYFVNKPNDSYIIDGYAVVDCNVSELETTYNYHIVKKEIKTEENPKTGDSIISNMIIEIISLISLTGCTLYINKKRFN